MRIVFAGTPEAAVPTLRGLAASPHEIVAVLTREDAPVGRKRRLTPSPVAAAAEELGLPVVKANRIDDAVTARLLAADPELGVVVAYGGLIREPLLSTPNHGWVNLHFSKLPRWRGAAPVQRALMAGDRASGIAVFQLEPGLDTGPTYVNREVAIESTETAGDLLARLAELGVPHVLATAAALEAGDAVAEPQRGETAYAAKLETSDGVIDWREPVGVVDARIRGVTPEPGAATTWRHERLKIHRATLAAESDQGLAPGQVEQRERRVLVGCGRDAAGRGALELLEVQPAGKRPMAAADWFRGVTDSSVHFESPAPLESGPAE